VGVFPNALECRDRVVGRRQRRAVGEQSAAAFGALGMPAIVDLKERPDRSRTSKSGANRSLPA